MTAKDFPAGLKVQIAKCKDFPCAVGKWATVCAHQDCPGKIKVSFGDEWQGYFTPEQLVAIAEPQREIFNLIRERDNIQKSISGLKHDLEKVEQQIKGKAQKYKLCPECGAPVLRKWNHDDLLYRLWTCSDRNCHGQIIE